MPITPLPTPPTRNDPTTFADRGDALLGALPTFVTQANALEAAVEADKDAAAGSASAAATSAAVASAAANFKGAWSSLTGALSVPASVSHSGSFWVLLNDLANVATSEPGVSADWVQVVTVGNHYQEFLSSGTWTKPAGVTWVYVEAVGGGGGGYWRGDSAEFYGAAGGEGASVLLRASEITGSVLITVGAGGAGRATFGAGANGGNTSFGGYITAYGGKGQGDGTTRPGMGQGLAAIRLAVNQLFGYGGGGSSVYGGGGGGLSQSSFGRSEFAGNGGVGSANTGELAGNGVVPGGGGGNVRNGDITGQPSGSGASGRVRVWAW